jgi:hypothetical protein
MLKNGRKRLSQKSWELGRQFKRTRVEEQRIELFDSVTDSEIKDPRNSTPIEIVKILWHCLTSLTPSANPSRNTEKKYRDQVFDWWDKVKENRNIRSALIRARLLNYVSTHHLKKLGILDILYDSHCPPSPTVCGANVAASVSRADVVSDANVCQADISHGGCGNDGSHAVGNHSATTCNILEDDKYVNCCANGE